MGDAKERPDAYVPTVVDSGSATPDTATPRDGEPEADALGPGMFVGGRYRVVRFIARGGMGEVYEAFDEELRVAVALKVATKTTGRALDRFKREVTLARRVTHKNVCRLFEIGFHPVGGETVPYCTMELLEGETLSARLERGPLPLADARTIVEQITAGLQAAHDVGVIHRDFKSNNILLVKDGDGRERAVISDFGLARAEVSVDGDGSALTADQSLVGTPAYMAPEQVECKPATTATDIYALGIVMFELVTGELPFRAETPMATAVLRLTQPPPSARARRPELPVGWDLAIRRCLELAPANRFARAGEVALALDNRPPRRLLPWVAGIAAAGIAAAVGIGMRSEHAAAPAIPRLAPGQVRWLVVADPAADDTWRATEAGELLRAEVRIPGALMPLDGDETAPLARDLATAKDPDARRSAIVHIAATTVAQILITGELRAGMLHVRLVDLASGQVIEDYAEPVTGDDLAGAVARLGSRLRDRLAGADVPLDADHAAKVLPTQPDAARAYAEGLAAGRAHDHQHAIASLEHATTLAKDFAPAYLALVRELRAVRQAARAATAADSAFALAGSLRSDQRLRAEALYRESRKEWPQAENLWSTLLAAQPDDITVVSALAHAAMATSDTDKCFAVLDRLRGRPAPTGDDPRIDVQEALCARQSGDFRRGLSAATRADVKAGVRGAREVQQQALALEGEQLANAGEYDRALVVLGRARQLAEVLGDREAVVEAMRQTGFVLGEQGKLEEAATTFKAAISGAQQIGDRLAEGILKNDFGQFMPRAVDALAIFKDALAIAKDQGDERLVTAASLNVANKQDATGDVDGALATYADVIARAKTQHDDENLATALMNSSDSMMKLDRYTEALPRIEEALASFQQRGDEDGVGYSLMSRGDAHFGLGDLAAARTDYDAALTLRTKLGEARNVAKSQVALARLDLAEDRAGDAEPLARASVEMHRKENDTDELANSLRVLARVLITLGKRDEAITALDECQRIYKPDPSDASEDALIRGLADPADAEAQLAIIHGSEHDPTCAGCELLATLDEAELERGLGHAARSRELLVQISQRAKAMHAANVIDRARRLLAKP
jgi:tetratricopeptide (TPR) repeat protein